MTGQVAPVAGEFRVATRRSRLLGPTLAHFRWIARVAL